MATFFAMLYDAGAGIKSAQKFMGHSSIQVTLKIFTHLSEGKEQMAVDALNRLLVSESCWLSKRTGKKSGRIRMKVFELQGYRFAMRAEG